MNQNLGGFATSSTLGLVCLPTKNSREEHHFVAGCSRVPLILGRTLVVTLIVVVMGLAEPRKRIKIAHDPRNLAWSQSESSYGQRLMHEQGWRAGQSLGARRSQTVDADDAARLAASRVGVLYKDDTLGLGAQLKSQDVQHQRTGLDAFQGLLGRLNSRNEEELKQVEQKIEDKKLVMFAQGRWGGMTFVPGGVLVQGDEFKKKDSKETQESKEEAVEEVVLLELDEEAERKSEKRRRREERRARKEQKRAKTGSRSTAQSSENSDENAITNSAKIEPGKAPDEPVSSAEEDATATPPASNTANRPALKNGRLILRGRNIAAKRMAFSNMKGLDEIFMNTP